MILIIGATGFIGYYTTRAFLEKGYDVLGTGLMDSSNVMEELGASYVKLDISNKDNFEVLPTTGVEGVILLAGLLPANAKVDITKDENADDYIKINTLGTINTLEYCRKNNIKKIISTTSYADIFGHWQKGVAIDDDLPRKYSLIGDHAAYVISKNAATDMILYYNAQHGMQGSIFRFPPVYGVGPHNEIYKDGKYYKTGIGTFIEKAQNGENIEIWGDPTITRDIVYVKDVADAFVKAIESDKACGVYNITSNTELSLLDQVKTIIDLYGDKEKSQIVYRPDKKNNTPSFLFSIEKAKRDFGYNPKFLSYRDMMIDYMKEEKNGVSLVFKDRKKDEK